MGPLLWLGAYASRPCSTGRSNPARPDFASPHALYPVVCIVLVDDAVGAAPWLTSSVSSTTTRERSRVRRPSTTPPNMASAISARSGKTSADRCSSLSVAASHRLRPPSPRARVGSTRGRPVPTQRRPAEPANARGPRNKICSACTSEGGWCIPDPGNHPGLPVERLQVRG